MKSIKSTHFFDIHKKYTHGWLKQWVKLLISTGAVEEAASYLTVKNINRCGGTLC